MNGHFVKMQGVGNDFILIDNRRGIWPLDALHLRRWCDRRLGVGADQLLVLEETRRPDADFRYRIFNADGGEVEQCGNGARCMTRWVLERIFPGECVRFETMRAVIRGSIGKDGLVSVEMGMPILEADDLPFRTDGLSYCGGAWRGFGLSGTDELCVLAVGNPHAVRFGLMPVDEVFCRTGERLQDHPAFPEGINFECVCPRSDSEADFRVWERGVGETPACGSGACAAAVAGMLTGRFGRTVTFHTGGGILRVRRPDPDGPVFLEGPAEYVFEGDLPLD